MFMKNCMNDVFFVIYICDLDIKFAAVPAVHPYSGNRVLLARLSISIVYF